MQNYTDIASSKSLQESLPLLLGNDKTALSSSAGTAFPTTNLLAGMFCFRTDQNKLYKLIDLAPTWVLMGDFSTGNFVASQAATVMGWTPVQQGGGTGQGTNKVQIGWNAASSALFLAVDGANYGGNWPINIAGSASKLASKDAGNASGNVPISNATVNVDLNADMVDGYHASVTPGIGAIPVVDSTGVLATYTKLAKTQAAKDATESAASTAFVDRLRSLLVSTTTGTAVLSDRGSLVQISAAFTIPSNVFAANDILSIANVTGGNQTIAQGSGLTLHFAGSVNTGNRTALAWSLMTVVFLSPTVAVISGAGLT
jgi:hypothetical protein